MTVKKRWIEPPLLKKGDRIGVVAPAGPVDPGTLDKGLGVLRQMGFEPVPGQFVRKRSGFLAGSDKERALDLMAMFCDPDIHGIVCARGGYGVNRVLSSLKADVIRKNAKVVVGCSDVTLLLIYLNQMCRTVAYHGPLAAASFGCHPMALSKIQFVRMLTEGQEPASFKDPKSRTLFGGTAEGRLAGGNLTLMCRSLGTPYEIETRGSLLLIEDVNEPAYKVDGMLWQLGQAGKFKGVKGLIVGEMIDCRFNKGQKGNLDDVFRDHFEKLKIPVMVNCPIGHGPEIWTLPVGRKASLDTGKRTLVV
ncbi:MAG: LD-carboxypeptidase [Candidatus Nitronauta litoralis]|uniref:LD-carboxypeptidase n=1 Tax=Candidatus Nitronauta litoralis TaxID=2705533 RepID=A0A7T0G0N9_9BACT|nr:MAG: LD-carboxypeptidase [Candidatus Nitronauta litoralis]